MATARAERLVNLVLCLLSTRQYLTADRIRSIVPGYPEVPNDEAFFRMFERDKAELRDLGVPLEVGRNSAFDRADGYRIARRDYELGDIDLDPGEAAAVALAVRLWDAPELAGAARGALLKLRAAGVDVDEQGLTAIEPKVRASEPAFAPLLTAVQTGRVVHFDYRRAGSPDVTARTVEPWGVVSWRGRWYLVGHDRDRGATRCFRLSRIVGEVTKARESMQVPRPDVDLLRIVAGDQRRQAQASTPVRVWAAVDRAQGLRREATVVGTYELGGEMGDVLTLDVHSPEAAATWIAGYGPDVVVLEPDTLRKAVNEVHLAVLEAGAPR